MTIKQIVDKLIDQWNTQYPGIEYYLGVEEKGWVINETDHHFRVIVIYQKIIRNPTEPLEVYGIVNTKTVLFMQEWVSVINRAQAIKRCYESLLETILFHGLSNGLKAIENINKYNPGARYRI